MAIRRWVGFGVTSGPTPGIPATMWVVLRLLVAISVGVVRFFYRRTTRGELRRGARTDWVLATAKHKGSVVATMFGVPFSHPIYFRLSEENALDRFFKGIGFTREVQTGDPNFDQVVYVSCDHPALAPVLQEDALARAAILSLFGKDTKSIYADGEHLWARRSGDAPPGEAELDELRLARDALQMVPSDQLQLLRDAFFWKALLVESIAWTIAVYGLAAAPDIATRSHPQYFEWWPVLKTGLVASVGVFAFLFGLAWWILRGSSRAHRVFTESALVLLIGVPLSSIQMVSDANIALDRSTPAIIEQRVADRYTRVTTGKRRRTHYHLRLSGAAPAGMEIPTDIEVSLSVYGRASKGGPITIRMRGGALGLPWVEEVRPGR